MADKTNVIDVVGKPDESQAANQAEEPKEPKTKGKAKAKAKAVAKTSDKQETPKKATAKDAKKTEKPTYKDTKKTEKPTHKDTKATEEPAVTKKPAMKRPAAQDAQPTQGQAKAKAKAKSASSTILEGAVVDVSADLEDECEVCEGREEEMKAEDPEVSFRLDENLTSAKDRSKNQKFQALLKSGLLPEWLVSQWKKSLTMKGAKIETQRRLVNLAIDRDPSSGKLMLNTNKGFFKTIKACLP